MNTPFPEGGGIGVNRRKRDPSHEHKDECRLVRDLSGCMEGFDHGHLESPVQVAVPRCSAQEGPETFRKRKKRPNAL